MSNTWHIGQNTGESKKVFVGLSGGVDSAVSAALLTQEGYDVTGVFIRIAVEGYPCTAGEDKLSAQRVAAHLKIPFIEVDLSREYKERVFNLSIQEFGRARTPNPDALCNREIKFGIFFDWCMDNGADLVATGHYAQVSSQNNPLRVRDFSAKKSLSPRAVALRSPSESYPSLLLAGIDKEKDQSYFLALVPKEKLARTLFPIGHLHKSEVRALAAKFGLPNAARKDSQGLCFLGPISIHDMLKRELTLIPGDVLNESGEVIGRHEGVAALTLGQRHGFTLFAHTPDTKPHYVIAKDVAHNTVTVSLHKFPIGAHNTHVTLIESNWIGEVSTMPLQIRYRYRQPLINAHTEGDTIVLHEPHYVPEGQIMVVYRGDECIGGGIIESAWLSLSPSQTVLKSHTTLPN